MKYSVGQKVKIRSLEWYRDNVNRYGIIECGKYEFFEPMNEYCGKVVTIKRIDDDNYRIDTDKGAFCWTDEMIEELVEEGTKSEQKFHIGDWATDGDVLAEDSCIFIIQKLGDNSTAAKTYCTLHNDGYFEKGSILYFDIDSTKPATEDEKQKLFRAIKDNGYKWNSETKTLEKLIEPLDVPTMTTEFVKEHGLPCPEGFIFKDENGNIINAQKIVLEKKKKEYPKTFLGCCDVLGIEDLISRGVKGYKSELLDTFQKLLICRDAYWKIAGDEMGLNKPWKPDWEDEYQEKYIIGSWLGTIQGLEENFVSHPLAFPTEEMRDAFYENFKEEIEICKELL